jgi:outer membrane protein assembly factor BamD
MKQLLTLLALLLAVAGCPRRGQVRPSPADPESGLRQALADIEAKKYRQAQDDLTFIIFNYPGSVHAADAQFYLAESYFAAGDYIQAQTEYDFYLKSFPNGRHQEEATYRLALASLRSAPGHDRDQTRALRARELVEEFLDRYPESPFLPQAESVRAEVEQRLARREFDAARLYYTSGEYGSALVYYEYVRTGHPFAAWPADDELRHGICLAEAGRTDEARARLSAVVAGNAPEPLKQQARERLARLP